MLTRLKSFARLNLTLFVSLILVLQSAGAAIAPCRLGFEGHGCCSAHTQANQPSCCSAETQRPSRPTSPQDGPEASKRDCTCELFGDLPKMASSSESESVPLHLLSELYGSACVLVHEAGGHACVRSARARPPTSPPGARPGSCTLRCAQLGSWRL